MLGSKGKGGGSACCVKAVAVGLGMESDASAGNTSAAINLLIQGTAGLSQSPGSAAKTNGVLPPLIM